MFETIWYEAQLSLDYKLSLFDLQLSSYESLQQMLISLGESSFYVLTVPKMLTTALMKYDLLSQQTLKAKSAIEHSSFIW